MVLIYTYDARDRKVMGISAIHVRLVMGVVALQKIFLRVLEVHAASSVT